MSSILSNIVDSSLGYIQFDTENEYNTLSKQFMEELENCKTSSFIKITEDISEDDVEEEIKEIYYTTYHYGNNMMFKFRNEKLSTCMFFWVDNKDADLTNFDFWNLENKKYNRMSIVHEGTLYDLPSYIEYFDNGKINSVGFYKEGIRYRKDYKQPAWISYDNKGQLRSKGFYKDGELHNEEGYALVSYVMNKVDKLNSHYYLNGVKLTKNQWEKDIVNMKKPSSSNKECLYCKTQVSTKYRLQDHIKVCGGKKFLDSNKELNVLYYSKKYYPQIFQTLIKTALQEGDFDLLKMLKDNDLYKVDFL